MDGQPTMDEFRTWVRDKLLAPEAQRLTPREELVLRLRYCPAEGEKVLTMEEVGLHPLVAALNTTYPGKTVTRERIRQLEATAIRKLGYYREVILAKMATE